VRNWWRWALRELAAVALVVGGVLLFQPLPVPSTSRCPTPFWQVLGQTPVGNFSPPPSAKGSADPVAACKNAASDREHAVDALGLTAVVLVGLSFLSRRRAPTTKRLEPSPV